MVSCTARNCCEYQILRRVRHESCNTFGEVVLRARTFPDMGWGEVAIVLSGGAQVGGSGAREPLALQGDPFNSSSIMTRHH